MWLGREGIPAETAGGTVLYETVRNNLTTLPAEANSALLFAARIGVPTYEIPGTPGMPLEDEEL
jgi:hypothetical protein